LFFLYRDCPGKFWPKGALPLAKLLKRDWMQIGAPPGNGHLTSASPDRTRCLTPWVSPLNLPFPPSILSPLRTSAPQIHPPDPGPYRVSFEAFLGDADVPCLHSGPSPGPLFLSSLPKVRQTFHGDSPRGCELFSPLWKTIFFSNYYPHEGGSLPFRAHFPIASPTHHSLSVRNTKSTLTPPLPIFKSFFQ